MREAQSASASLLRPLRVLCLFVTLAGCGGGSPVGAQARAGVTFRVPVNASLFAAGASLQVQVWSEDQLAAVERNSRCSTVFDPATGAQEIRCPEGTSYQQVKPEEFDFPVHELAGTIAVRSTTVRIGEKFRILLAGKSGDGCNTTSARHLGSADAVEVVIASLGWQTTARACAGGSGE